MADQRRGVALICSCGGEVGGDGDERRRCTCEEERRRSQTHLETYVLALVEHPERKPN